MELGGLLKNPGRVMESAAGYKDEDYILGDAPTLDALNRFRFNITFDACVRRDAAWVGQHSGQSVLFETYLMMEDPVDLPYSTWSQYVNALDTLKDEDDQSE